MAKAHTAMDQYVYALYKYNCWRFTSKKSRFDVTAAGFQPIPTKSLPVISSMACWNPSAIVRWFFQLASSIVFPIVSHVFPWFSHDFPIESFIFDGHFPAMELFSVPKKSLGYRLLGPGPVGTMSESCYYCATITTTYEYIYIYVCMYVCM